MKIKFIVLSCFLFFCSKVYASHVTCAEDSTEILAKINADLCEWAQHKKTKMLKRLELKGDSTETYTIDTETKELLYIHIFRKPKKRSGQHIYYFYLHNKIFRIVFVDRNQGKMLIMKDTGSGLYCFREDTLIYKIENTDVKRTANFLIGNANTYFEKYIQYLNE